MVIFCFLVMVLLVTVARSHWIPLLHLILSVMVFLFVVAQKLNVHINLMYISIVN